METEKESQNVSTFQTKYDEFIDDLLGTLPEYTSELTAAKALDDAARLSQFQESVKVNLDTECNTNPVTILPGVNISDTVWNSLSDNTKKTIWEYVRVLSICSVMEGGLSGSKPEWMDDAMNDLKKKLEGVDFENILKKFMTFFKPDEKSDKGDKAPGSIPGFEKLFENGFPKIPEKFMKGHMAKLAQEIVKDITPEDLGMSKEMIDDCEKNPSRSFDILFKVFSNNPDIIQKTIQKIGKRLQEKILSGAIKPQEIAREAEELMKEFSDNSGFVDMMEGIKKSFGFEDMDIARKAGKEGSARLSIVKERLRKKMAQKDQHDKNSTSSTTMADSKRADAVMASLLKESNKPKKKKK